MNPYRKNAVPPDDPELDRLEEEIYRSAKRRQRLTSFHDAVERAFSGLDRAVGNTVRRVADAGSLSLDPSVRSALLVLCVFGGFVIFGIWAALHSEQVCNDICARYGEVYQGVRSRDACECAGPANPATGRQETRIHLIPLGTMP